jgi:hypothetical protein
MSKTLKKQVNLERKKHNKSNLPGIVAFTEVSREIGLSNCEVDSAPPFSLPQSSQRFLKNQNTLKKYNSQQNRPRNSDRKLRFHTGGLGRHWWPGRLPTRNIDGNVVSTAVAIARRSGDVEPSAGAVDSSAAFSVHRGEGFDRKIRNRLGNIFLNARNSESRRVYDAERPAKEEKSLFFRKNIFSPRKSTPIARKNTPEIRTPEKMEKNTSRARLQYILSLKTHPGARGAYKITLVFFNARKNE